MRGLPCQEDAYLRVVASEVVACEVADGGFDVVLDRTPFYPEGGGQPSDTGTVGGAPVLGLSVGPEGAVAHRLAGPLAVGSVVEAAIDWGRRFDHMQQHTAQHILTATAQARLGWRTLAFHLGPDRCDIDLDEASLPADGLAALEEAVNARVREARPVRVRSAAQDEMAALGVRSRLLPAGFSGTLRLVEIEGVDLNTCGGTHVSNTSEIQAIKLLGTERVARGTRLFFLAGGRVLRELDRALERDRELGRLLTCGRDEHLASVERLAAERRDLGRAVADLKAALASRIGRDLARGCPSTVATFREPEADGDLLRAVAAAARAERADLLVLATGGAVEGPVLLAGPEARVAAAWPVVTEILEARGGGRDGVRQGRAKRADRIAEAAGRLGN